MNSTLATISIVIGCVTPFVTAAFVFGIIKGTMNGLSKTVDGIGKRVVSNENLLISHLNKHCLDCPGSYSSPSNRHNIVEP